MRRLHRFGGRRDRRRLRVAANGERLDPAAGGTHRPEIGVSDPHHPLTHHGNDPDKIARMAKINAFHVSLFAYFLEKLKSTPEGDGSLLDHSLYLYGSGMGNPNVHDHVNLPILVAGGTGRIAGGRHIKYAEPKPLANLHVTLLERVGVRVDAFADSQGKVDELLSL